MSPALWLGVAQLAVTLIVLLLSLSWRGGSWTGNERRRVGELEREFKAHCDENARRFHDAGEETSKAMTYVQGMESRFTREFSNRELTDERFKENRREHDRYDTALGVVRGKRASDPDA